MRIVSLSLGLCAVLLFLGLLPTRAEHRRRASYYGPGIQFDVLNNQPVKQADVDIRFRAAYSGPLKSFKWFNAYGKHGSNAPCDGYGCGTGGEIEICLLADDGKPQHRFAGAPLACVTPQNLRTGDRLREDRFPQPPRLRAGSLYHLRWHNASLDPDKNYISVNDTCVWRATTPRQPNIPDTDLAVLAGGHVVETDTPILELTYTDGQTQGQGYKESWNYMAENISGGAEVRENFTVSGPEHKATAVAVRLNRVRGASPLHVRLETASGELLEEGEIEAARFPEGRPLTREPWDSQYVVPAWGRLEFKRAQILRPGQSYHLVLSAPQDTLYQAYGIQRASGYGFSNRSFFADGRGEASHDRGLTWAGFRQTESSVDHRDADIQFFFVVR